MKNGNNFEIVKKILDEYLIQHGQRKTQERYTILKEIYAGEEHFDAVTLHYHLSLKQFKISMGTIYNNMKLFEKAGLITKNRLDRRMSQYTKSLKPKFS
ncbi:MAG: transcriptional repressor [Bacteroidota bacterium]